MNIKNFYEPIFQDEKAAINFLKSIDFFGRTIRCVCGVYTKRVKSMLFKKGICFYCANGCYKRQSIYTGTIRQKFCLPAFIQLRIIYCWVMGMSNSMACVTCEISELTYTSYKDEIFKKIKNEVDNYFGKIGGPGKFIQVD
ncbi:hypothetical protein NCER_102101 [Vairimorpha ceranae BRL01]|uniref:Uncharacterized protein n=2 Tax=Vairimorpha ceranae TaxID=40302 RepID=C4VBE5_VAIC1|nr:hypothetical protein AAJ76_2720002269 [Vairimorpha ceranae]EEQ81457.1 hypothetical protein NCER_102101 [Vairimorpha ceranae BRL01]KAF5141535.1 hypothetical protein G9O61_00g002740 [Vairimorpha ceranae]KKO73727.1 hypothetical protein AAJ76_2720002269 [Vairimorpha ceranae]